VGPVTGEPQGPALESRHRQRAEFDPITGRWSALVFHVPADQGELFAGEALEQTVGRTIPLRFPGGYEEQVRVIAASVDADGRGYSLTVAPVPPEPA
jgi:hypothetical protein